MQSKYGAVQEDIDEMDLDFADSNRQGGTKTAVFVGDVKPNWIQNCKCTKCQCNKQPCNNTGK